MHVRTRRSLLFRVSIAVLVLLALPLAIAHAVLRASLPILEGELSLAGPTGPVWIERDAMGIPTIEALTRADVAFGTGFVHAQDRFFQMDLSRRLAAGELSMLFGEVAREQDERARIFRFRDVAREIVRQARPHEQQLLEAYTAGVNAGLASLRSRPWEYWVLRSEPARWEPEDSLLVAHAMWWDLQYGGFRREMLKRQIDERVGGARIEGWKRVTCFLYPNRTEWDSPNVASDGGDVLPAAFQDCSAVPTPDELDVRGAGPAPAALHRSERVPAAGSNNWAVAGHLTASGAALVANDMHLNLRVPNVWYRARLRVPAADPDDVVDLNGVTLAGTPLLIAGSNGRIAWGYTNSYGDWLDVIPAACDADSHTSEGVLFQRGPGPGRCWYARWLAAVPEATNLRLLDLEKARSVQEALALAPFIGIPHQNAVIGDREGHIAWTIFGRIPRARGPGRNSAEGGWIDAQNHPRIVDSPAGFVWSANARPSSDVRHELAIGDDEVIVGTDFELGARAQQISEGLATLNRAGPGEMLAIQLDDRVRFLRRWRELLLDILDDRAVRNHPQRAEFRRLISDLEPRADVNAVGYRLLRTYHDHTERAVWQMILHALQLAVTEAPVPAKFEKPLWTLVTEQPIHMLSANYSSWRDFLLTQVDGTIAELAERCPELARCTWGARQPVHIRHPLSSALPVLSRLIDMPVVELPGDHDMPRVQSGAFGASERFAVSPGNEAEGYLSIAGGQSGHPLSPFYRAGFAEWAAGQPVPLLPGEPRHRLVLTPVSGAQVPGRLSE